MATVERSDAYRLGQLLARLDRAGAVPDVHRLYGLAAVDPSALVPAIKRASGTERGRQLIAPVMERISGGAFERTLTAEEQSDFGLGYYHERAG